MERKTLHFDLGHVPKKSKLVLKAGLKEYLLTEHTTETRKKYRMQNQALQVVPDCRITHFAEHIKLPANCPQLLFVTSPSRNMGSKLDTMLLTFIHVPEQARRKILTKKMVKLSNTYIHPKLAASGVQETKDLQMLLDVDDWKTAFDTAVSLVFHHSELLNLSAETAAEVSYIIQHSNGISDLAMAILQQALAHQQDPSVDNWVVEKPYLNPDGTPAAGTSYYAWTDTTISWMKAPLKDSLKISKNDPDLQSTSTKAGCYTIQSGITAVSGEQNCNTMSCSEDGGDYWVLNNLTPHYGYENIDGVTMDKGIFGTTFKNHWLRWLSVYAEFLGPDGSPIEPENWKSQLGDELAKIYDAKTKKYLQLVPSVDTILGIPVAAAEVDISFAWPANASSVRLLSGGIGRTGGIQGKDGQYHGGWDSQVCVPGAIMTGFFNLGIPMVCLVAGVTVESTVVNELAKISFSIIMEVAEALVDGPLAASLSDGDLQRIMLAFANVIPHLLLEATALAAYLDAKIAQGATEETVPVFGWIAAAVSVVCDIALLTQTIAEVAQSPATFEFVATRAIDANWTLLPDANHQNTWPLIAHHYIVTATYKDGTTRSVKGDMDSSPQTGPIMVAFNKEYSNRLPAGGTVMFKADFYSENNWLCGSVSTDFINADIEDNLLVVPQMNIVENVIPLSATTVYEFNNTLLFNEATQQHEWSKSQGCATATIKDLSADNTGNNLAKTAGITISQSNSQIGYVWQASGQNLPLEQGGIKENGQMFAFQTIDVRNNPQSALKSVACGFINKPMLLFDINGPSAGNNFYIDSRKGAYHLRQLVLDQKTEVLNLAQGISWGRFNQQIDACIIHPSGYAVGVNSANSKLEVLRLPLLGGTDQEAPFANLYSGYGSRSGLLHNPLGLAAAPGAGVIVLEDRDVGLGCPPRLQAFDLFGNPAGIFMNGMASVELSQENWTYLDVAVESKGFIYVLKYYGDGSSYLQYWLDIYNPDGSFLTQTPGIAAGKLTVDLWRTVYTLNFQKISKPDGEQTEPSVSIWVPTI